MFSYEYIPRLVYFSGSSHATGIDTPWDYVLLPYLGIEPKPVSNVLGNKIDIFHCPSDKAPRRYQPYAVQSYIINSNRGPSCLR